MSDEASHRRAALENAWIRFATYDDNAGRLQQRFLRLRLWILAVGVAATALAIVYAHVEVSTARPHLADWRFYLWLPVVAAPIVGSVLAAGASKLARGADWIHLRGAAESVKREILRYRCRIGLYGLERPASTAPDERLATAVSLVTGRLMETEILRGSLEPYRGTVPPPGVSPEDDGFSDMGPADYLSWRLGDQQAYFKAKSAALDRRHQRWQWTIAILGGTGTLLAAIGWEIWVPVSVAIATALTSFMELRNVESNLAGYNRGALELDNVATWWSGLADEIKAEPAAFTTLVDRTETILSSENATWVQGMRDALARAGEGEECPECPECRRRRLAGESSG